MRKPKILQINTVADAQNSVGGIMRSLSSYIQSQGWDSRIACGRGDMSGVDYMIGDFFSVMSHVIASRITDCEGWRSEKATTKFLHKLDEWSPDIVHLHNLHGHYLHLPTLFEWLNERGVPVVMTLHDLWWLTGHCAFYNHRDCSPRLGCHDCRYHREEYPVSLFSRSQRNRERKMRLLESLPRLMVVAPSARTRDELQATGLYERCRVIKHGINLDEFNLCDKVERQGVYAVAARWEKRKNLEAINRLAESGRCDEPLTVVGHLMGQTLHEDIRYLPVVDTREDLVKIYSSAKILLIPSISETFGLTAVEAMASGTPVIVNEKSAIADIVTPLGGRVISMDDPVVIADTIDEMLWEYDSFNPRATAGYYSAERMGEDYMSLYRELLGGAGG